MGTASFYFHKQRSCKWCFHLRTDTKLSVRCDKQGWKRIVLDIKDLFASGGAANLQAIELQEKAKRCKYFMADEKDKFL